MRYFKTAYTGSIIAFIILEILAVWTTYTIIGQGGQEVYPLMVNIVQNKWLLIGSKFVALAFLLIPFVLIRKYNLRNKSVYLTISGVMVLNICVAIYDVGHNLMVLL